VTLLDDRPTEAEPPAATGAPVLLPRRRTRLRDVLREYRPSVVTGGLSTTPLLVIAAINMADEFDRIAFSVLLPEIQDYFGVSLTTVLTFSAIAGILPLLLAVPIGYLADRLPRTKLLAVGVATWGLFSVLTGLAPTLLLLAVARFGSGLGKTLNPAQQSLLSDYYPPHRRAGVFSVNQLGNELGQVLAPVTAGALASVFFWQVPFLVFGVPAFLLAALLVLRLREPVRGAQERAAMGASAESVAEEEAPPGWAEAWRVASGVRTLRRIWWCLPFLVGSVLGVASLMSVFYDEEFGLSSFQRGVASAIVQVSGVVGLVLGGGIGNRILARRPSRVVTLAGGVAMIPALAYLLVAVTPWLPVIVLLHCAAALALSVFGPTSGAVISLVVPPRVRSFAFAIGAVFVAPGVLVAPLAGALADAYGARAGVALLAPVFAIGAFILASAGRTVDDDVRAATASSLAQQATRQAREEGRTKLLVVKDLDVAYGSVQVLFGVDFEIEQGEIVALLGTNGAGKSTLLRAIGGDTPASNGAISFDGEDITHLPPKEHVVRGIVQVPGGKGIFPSLTVEQNLELAAWTIDDAARVAQRREEVFGYFPRLRERLGQQAGNLSGGEQQMLALGQAFLARPKLLMIDELTLGLAPVVVEELLEIVRAIHAEGTTVLLVEQSVNVALEVAQRAVFMEKGELRFSGPTSELLQRSDLLRSVFLTGGEGAAAKKRAVLPGTEAEAVLQVQGLSKRYGGVQAVNGVDLTLREGEILGLIGPNGAGKTTIFDLISGHVTPTTGRVTLLGEDVSELGPDRRAELGLHRCFQDARLFPALTVEETLLVALDRNLAVRSGVAGALRLPNVRTAEAKLRKRADRLLSLLNLGSFRDTFIRELSTGTRRLVDIGCVLASDPAVLLLDEPSSGVAQRETEELAPLIQRVKFETNCSILLIEHDMTLIAEVSDELVALETGAVVLRGTPSDVLHDPRVVESYLGTRENKG
jgi:ABC-type branched-subunit amino acid transport system ATPase component/predicted MFS family arabinose efflux permease